MCAGELRCSLNHRGAGVGWRLDHHPHERFGPARADEHAALAVQLGLDLSDLVPQLGRAVETVEAGGDTGSVHPQYFAFSRTPDSLQPPCVVPKVVGKRLRLARTKPPRAQMAVAQPPRQILCRNRTGKRALVGPIGCWPHRRSEPMRIQRSRALASNQLQRLETRVAVLADDEMVVHGNAERARDLDDCLGHLDVGARGRRIGGGMGCTRQPRELSR